MTSPPTKKQNGSPATAESTTSPRLRDGALCAWFVLTALAFWGPYAGVDLPFNVLTALYAVFLLVFIADAALRFLRRDSLPSDTKGGRRG